MNRVGSKQLRKHEKTVFPIIVLWEISVAIETRVLIQSAPNPDATFTPPKTYITLNFIAINQLVSEILYNHWSTDRTKIYGQDNFFLFPYCSSVFDDGKLPCMVKLIVMNSLFCNYNYFPKICFDMEKKCVYGQDTFCVTFHMVSKN